MPIKPALASVLAFSALLLGACAQTMIKPVAEPASSQAAPAVAQDATEPPDETPASSQPAATVAAKGPELPDVELTDRIVFEL